VETDARIDGISELNELRVSRREPALKRLVADLTLDKHILQECRKKSLKLPSPRDRTVDLCDLRGDELRSCRLILLRRSVFYYKVSRETTRCCNGGCASWPGLMVLLRAKASTTATTRFIDLSRGEPRSEKEEAA